MHAVDILLAVFITFLLYVNTTTTLFFLHISACGCVPSSLCYVRATTTNLLSTQVYATSYDSTPRLLALLSIYLTHAPLHPFLYLPMLTRYEKCRHLLTIVHFSSQFA